MSPLAMAILDALRVEPELREELRRMLAEDPSPGPDTFVSVAEAGRIAGVCTRTVTRWIRAGKLTEHRAGRCVRVCRRELEHLLRDGARDRERDRELTPEEQADRDFE